MTIDQEKQNIINIAERLYENATKMHYGSVSVTLKIHAGRVVSITHTTSEITQKRENVEIDINHTGEIEK